MLPIIPSQITGLIDKFPQRNPTQPKSPIPRPEPVDYTPQKKARRVKPAPQASPLVGDTFEWIIQTKKKTKYEGELKEGKAHGYGTFTTIRGDKFSGNWDNGTLKGPIMLVTCTGMTLKGNWNNGWEGEVTATATGEVYFGQFKPGPNGYLTREGFGVLVIEGRTLIGDWNNHSFTRGKVSYPENHKYKTYTGEMRGGYFHGEGKLTLNDPDHTEIHGIWENDILVKQLNVTNFDLCTWKKNFESYLEHESEDPLYNFAATINNFIYDTQNSDANIDREMSEAEVSQELDRLLEVEKPRFVPKPKGNGYASWTNAKTGYTYTGLWSDEEFLFGDAIIKKEDEEIKWTGDFHNFQPHGKCKRTSSLGLEIDGIWEHGRLKSGIAKSGTEKYEGEFLNNCYHGKGVLVTDYGRYEGSFFNGLFEGEGVFIPNDQETFKKLGITAAKTKGIFKQGKIWDGFGPLYFSKLKLPMYGEIREGKLFTGIGYLRVEKQLFAGIIKDGKPFQGQYYPLKVPADEQNATPPNSVELFDLYIPILSQLLV